jgi:hypothetical protein
MYEIRCEICGKVGFHPSRVAARSRAETHESEHGHACCIGAMDAYVD